MENFEEDVSKFKFGIIISKLFFEIIGLMIEEKYGDDFSKVFDRLKDVLDVDGKDRVIGLKEFD